MNILADYTLRTVLLGCIVLGLCSGALGSMAVLRRQGLLGDALAHACLPGVCMGFLLTGSKAPLVLMVGAALAAWAASACILALVQHLGVDQGSALASVLTVFFGAGVVLLGAAQRMPGASAGGLDQMLFGQAASLTQEQVAAMAIVGGLACLVMIAFLRPLKVLAFDPGFAESVGLRPRRLNALLSGLLVAAIVIGLNTVGVVLMSAMLVAPAAAARQWTKSLGGMVLLSAIIGALGSAGGAAVSFALPQAPTGPLVVLVLAAVALVSVGIGRGRLSRKGSKPPSSEVQVPGSAS